MQESEIQKIFKKNKSYCPMPFKEIYADNAGRYKFCCHANIHPSTIKYTTSNTTPFKYFFPDLWV